MTKGIIRCIDDLGRVVIPKEFRKVLGIDTGDKLELKIDDRVIEIRKYDLDDHFFKIQNIYYKSLNNIFPNKVLFFDSRYIYFGDSKKKLETGHYIKNLDVIDKVVYIENKLKLGDYILDNYYIIPISKVDSIIGYILISTDASNKEKIDFIHELVNNC